MTTVQVRRNEHGVSGITVSGHAGYAESGSDIVCAAASVLITTCANALESVAGISPIVCTKQRSALIAVDLPNGLTDEKLHDARIVFETVFQGLRDIAAQYPEYLQII